MEQAVRRFQAAMGLESMDRLLANLEHLSSLPRLRLGTGCSGSDIVVKVMNTLWQSFKVHNGIVLPPIDHAFSCESVPFKQSWITAHCKPRFLFKDWLQFSDLANRADEVYSETMVEVPEVDFLVVGFECDSVSSLNHSSAANRDTVTNGEGKTGSTAKATLDWIHRKRPFVCVMENVRNLHAKSSDNRSNLDNIVDSLNSAGYVVRAMLLDAPAYGCPARRQRWYIVAVRVASRPLTGAERCPAFLADLQKTVEAMRIEPFPLSDFLLDRDDRKLVEKRQLEEETAAQAELAKSSKKARLFKSAPPKPVVVLSWEQEHMEAFGNMGYVWPPDLSELPPCTVALGRRKQELVWLADKLCVDGQLRVDDINMSIYFSAPGSHVTPCIVSTCTMWMTDKKRGEWRELHGAELMALQGWDHHDQKPDPPATHEQLRDLAGNAFCAFQVAPVIIAILAVVDWDGLQRHKLVVEAPSLTGIETDTAADDSDDSGAGESVDEEGEEEEILGDSGISISPT